MVLIAFAAGLLIGPSGRQSYESGGVYDHCIKEFYEPQLYDWLAFENSCDVAVHVLYCKRGADRACVGSFDLTPGSHESTGRDRRQVKAYGGMDRYVCRKGFLAVDDRGDPITRGGRKFRCKAFLADRDGSKVRPHTEIEPRLEGPS